MEGFLQGEKIVEAVNEDGANEWKEDEFVFECVPDEK